MQTAPAISPTSSFTPALRVAGASAAAIRPMTQRAGLLRSPAIEMAAKKKSVKDLAPAELKGKKVPHTLNPSP